VARYPRLLSHHVELIAGTSAGGLLGLLLASGYTPLECRDIYVQAAKDIFTQTSTGAFTSRTWFPGVLQAKHSSAALKAMLTTYLGDRRFDDLKHYTLITSFRVDGMPSSHALHEGPRDPRDDAKKGWRPAVFSNLPFVEGVAHPDDDLLCVEAGMRTSAAPVFLPIHDGYADGALFAANPSLVAATKALAHFPGLRRADMRVLSLGAGCWPTKIETSDKTGDWGISQWAPHLLALLLDSNSLSTELLTTFLLGSARGIHRIDPVFAEAIAIDDVEAVPRLVQLGEEMDLSATFAFLDRELSAPSRPFHGLDEDHHPEAEPYAKAFSKPAEIGEDYHDDEAEPYAKAFSRPFSNEAGEDSYHDAWYQTTLLNNWDRAGRRPQGP